MPGMAATRQWMPPLSPPPTGSGEKADGVPDRPAGPDSLAGLGTLLRHVLDQMDGDIATVLADIGTPGFRPRFSPIVRALVTLGPVPIRDLARAIGVTHSAASQTVAQVRRRGLVTVRPGADARQRVVQLTAKARGLMPKIEAER